MAATEEEVLEQIRLEVATVLGGRVSAADVDPDIDIFGSADALVAGQGLDSLDIIEITTAIEDRFGLSFANDAALPPDLTLRALASRIAAIGVGPAGG